MFGVFVEGLDNHTQQIYLVRIILQKLKYAIILTLFEVEIILIERILFGFHCTDEGENYAIPINWADSRKMETFHQESQCVMFGGKN